MAMTNKVEQDLPPPTVLDRRGIDGLLMRLIAVHGEGGRPDIAPEITAAERETARRVEAAAEMVPAA
jgi:hypothetical protein